MANSKGAKHGLSETAMWSLTILTLAISCAVIAMLIQENQELEASNDDLAALETTM